MATAPALPDQQAPREMATSPATRYRAPRLAWVSPCVSVHVPASVSVPVPVSVTVVLVPVPMPVFFFRASIFLRVFAHLVLDLSHGAHDSASPVFPRNTDLTTPRGGSSAFKNLADLLSGAASPSMNGRKSGTVAFAGSARCLFNPLPHAH